MAGNDGDDLLAQGQQFPLKREAEQDPEFPTNEDIIEDLKDFIRETSSHNNTENEFLATEAPVRDDIDNGDKTNANSAAEGSKTKVEEQKVRDSQRSVEEGDGGSASAGDEMQRISGNNDSVEIVEERDPTTNELEAVSSSETSTNINEPQSEIPQDNSPESTGGTVTPRDGSLSSQIPSDNEQDTPLETTAVHTPDEIENGEDDEAESENKSESAENFDEDISWSDSDSQPKLTPEKKDPQATPDFMKMMAERELEIVQKKFEEQATEEAIKELARQDFGVDVPNLDQALIQEQEEIYKMIQMDLETSKACRSGQTGGGASSAPWDPQSVQGGDTQQGEVGVESPAEQADEQASGLVTQTSGNDQTQSDTGKDSRQATASSVPDRVDDPDEETEGAAGASEAPVSDPTIHGEGHLIKPILEEGTRPFADVIDQDQVEFDVKVMGEDMQNPKLDEEEYFKKRKSSEDSSSKANSSEDEDSEKDEDDQNDDGSLDDSPLDDSPSDGSPPDNSPQNNSPSDDSPQDDYEDPSQNGAPRDTKDGNQHQFSQSSDLSNYFQDSGIAEGDDSHNDAPQTLTSSDKKSNDLPPVLKPTPKATIQQLISEVKEWALPCLDSKDVPGGALQNVVQSLLNLGEAILRICDEKNGRGAREGDGGVENGDVDMGSLIEMLTASKLAANGIEPANGVSQRAEVEDSKDVDAEIPKLIPDCSLWKSTEDQETVSKNKADPSVDAEEIVDLSPRDEEQTNLTDSSSSDHESKEDLAAIAEKVLHWAYEGFEKEYFRPRPEYNNYTNRLAEDLWKRQYQLCIAEAEFEAEKARFREREFDMMDSQELKKREHAVEIREGVVKETERLLIERDTKLLEREEKMNRIERKSKERKKDEDSEGEGEGGDGEKKCKS